MLICTRSCCFEFLNMKKIKTIIIKNFIISQVLLVKLFSNWEIIHQKEKQQTEQQELLLLEQPAMVTKIGNQM